jgi:hypothetical protein
MMYQNARRCFEKENTIITERESGLKEFLVHVLVMKRN